MDVNEAGWVRRCDTGERDRGRSQRRCYKGAAGCCLPAEGRAGREREADEPSTLGTVIVTVWPPATGPWVGFTLTGPVLMIDPAT